MLQIAQAEDLNVSNLLVCNDPSGFMNDLSRFEGKPHAISGPRYILYWNEEMRNLRVYGHVGFLNLKRFVEPSWFGWPRSPFPYDYPSNYNQAKAAKEQGGVVTYVHPGLPSQYPVDIALGAADTIDVMCQGDEEKNTVDWYRLLNCGFRCPISAGTDCFLNVPSHLIAGAGRLYVETGGALSYDRWIKGYLKGNSFASNGPLLTFSVNGRGPGSELQAAAGPLRVEVKAEAVSHVPMQSLEVVVNGRTVLRREATDPHRIALTEPLTLERTSWVALRARGPAHRLVPNDTALYAHTSPVYCQLGDERPASKEDALFFVGQIDKLIANVERHGEFQKLEHREEVIRLFRKGQDVYRKIAAEGRAPARNCAGLGVSSVFVAFVVFVSSSNNGAQREERGGAGKWAPEVKAPARPRAAAGSVSRAAPPGETMPSATMRWPERSVRQAGRRLERVGWSNPRSETPTCRRSRPLSLAPSPWPLWE